ncbi:Ubp5-interacting protein ftp105 [Neolecta irregularis DAH-3]|uniref:Ubp5-interacting protein ftp105 n=1 Tax=Neolecta irregularis (strain DAH-3) TaxID=1198029 RepID=A0A1U7LUI9_NEOID|nr:Ubp5-interacting protein ftp105 [Neolecta irregularis DAH-3]|eukprot:OLL26340.1 Ubp5-interacting protein ftp105 [Neolecta irregularis DAH-3]
MGAVDSKLSFRKGVFRLFEERDIPADDSYWIQFWSLPESENEIYELFGPQDVRRTREQAPENLETLIMALTSRLFALRNHPSFPNAEVAPAREALNCIRVLSRLMPFIYEADLDEWEARFWWAKRRVRLYPPTHVRSPTIGMEENDEVLLGQDTANTTGQQKNVEEFFETKPLAHELVDTLIDLMFFSGFTLPSSFSGTDKVNFIIWQTGVGCTTPVGTSREYEQHKLEILSLLIALMSKPMYQSTKEIPDLQTNFVSYLVGYSDRKIVLTLLCSLLNTVMKYNPTGWKVPYDHVMFVDLRQQLVTYCLQVLVVILAYDPPPLSPGADSIQSERQNSNIFRHYYSKIHRKSDFQFITEGMNRILTQPIQANNSYTSFLPGSQAEIRLYPDMMMLFWETFKCNERFRKYLIDTSTGLDVLVLILYYCRSNKPDASQLGFVRMCIYILQTVTAENGFAVKLNQLFLGHASLPVSVRLPHFQGTYADFLIISIYRLIAGSKGSLKPLYPSMLLSISNIAPYVTNISKESSTKLLNLVTSISAPGFILAEEGNYLLLMHVLDIFNRILEAQLPQNPWLVSLIVRNHERFEALRDFTLDGALLEIEKIKNSQNDIATKGVTSSIDSKDTIATGIPANQLEPSSSAFSVVDDDGDKSLLPQEHSSSLPASSSLQSQESLQVVLPAHGRFLSEKARGKLPEGAGPRSPESDVVSLAFRTCKASGTSGPFTPSQEWVESWLPRLPLYTILTLVAQLAPRLKDTTDPTYLIAQLQELNESRVHPTDTPSSQPFVWTAQATGWPCPAIQRHFYLTFNTTKCDQGRRSNYFK